MKTLSRFVVKFTSSIVALLSCFDRVIFKGHLALSAPCKLEYFVDCVLKVRRSDFMKTLAPQYSNRLVVHARNCAAKAGRTYAYHTGQFRKDEWASTSFKCNASLKESRATLYTGSSIRPSTLPTYCLLVARPWPVCTAHCSTMPCAPSPPRTSWAFSVASGVLNQLEME